MYTSAVYFDDLFYSLNLQGGMNTLLNKKVTSSSTLHLLFIGLVLKVVLDDAESTAFLSEFSDNSA